MSDEEKQEAREPVKESASPREEKSATAKDDGEVDADDQGNDHGEHRERHKKKKHKEHKEHRDDKDRDSKRKRKHKEREDGEHDEKALDNADDDAAGAEGARGVENGSRDRNIDQDREERPDRRRSPSPSSGEIDRRRGRDRDRRDDYDRRDRSLDRDYDRRRSPPRRSLPRRSPPRRSPPRRSPPRRYDRGYDSRDFRRDDRRHGDRFDDRRGGRPYDRRGGYNDRRYDGGRRDYRRRSPSLSPSPPRRKKQAQEDDGKPKRFWDGFQWVDTDVKTLVTQQGSVGQATRKDRRLYVGNLPLGAGLTEKQLSEFISTSMRQRGMIAQEAPDPVLSVWLSPEGTYAFVEFHTVEHANNGLGLNGINLLTSSLRISRPNNYQPTVGVNIEGIMAMTQGAAVAGIATPALASLQQLLPNTPGLAALPQLQAACGAFGATAAGVPPAPPLTSTVLACANMLTHDEMMDTQEHEGLKEDVMDGCKEYGKLEAIKIPITNNPNCSVYIKFSTTAEAQTALKGLSGRKFDGRVVQVTSVPEAHFSALADGK
uniref:RRM domain-containing protein n=2 Tax=Chrysotila carterae TaxID=13221 RepID=A0A6S9X0L7_CHRCT|mmetsp:Transcript_34656/g.76203  ORF Transcript_34656/g.76203 Transcript_34656/m.76203 type:complete len:544 (+) Transcript_34656:18-1649(+)